MKHYWKSSRDILQGTPLRHTHSGNASGPGTQTERTYIIGNTEVIKGGSGHVATDIPVSIRDSGVPESKKGVLDKLSGAQGHVLCVLLADTKFEMVKHRDILEKRTGIG